MSMNSFHARTARPKSKVAVRAALRPMPAHAGVRADALLVQQGFAPSRTAAQRLIEAGRVSLDGVPVLKPAQLLPARVALAVAPPPSALQSLRQP